MLTEYCIQLYAPDQCKSVYLNRAKFADSYTFEVTFDFSSDFFMLNFFINSRTAIAGDIIGLLLVFYDSKRSIDFLKVFLFYRKYYSFRRCFDLKAKRGKIVVWNNFF